MKKTIFTALAFLAASWAQAATAQDDVLRDFLRCDGRFFSTLKQHSAEWGKEPSLRSDSQIAWLQVRDRSQSLGNFAHLVPPQKLGQLLANTYIDQFYDLGKDGLVYSWGFVVKGTPDEVAAAVRPYLVAPQYFRKDGAFYARTEIKWPKGKWQWSNNLNSNTPAGLDHVERVLSIEPMETAQGYSLLGCSVQGGVDKALLQEVRPDIR